MLGWFKKKFSKKKKQETPREQESVSDQEAVVAAEDGESVHGETIGDRQQDVPQEQVLQEPVADDAGEEPEENIEKDTGEDISARSFVTENRQDELKEAVAPEVAEISPESSSPPGSAVEEPAGITTETKDEPEPCPKVQVSPKVDLSSAEQKSFSEQGQEEDSEATDDDDGETGSASGKGELAVEIGTPEEDDAGIGTQEKTEVRESTVPTDDSSEKNSGEEAQEETLAELIAEAEADSCAETTSEAGDDIVDQTLEELLAPDQPDEDVGSTDVIADQESLAAEQDVEPDWLQKEGTEPETEAQPTVAGEEEDVIVDQPLEELLADEQADDVAGLAEEATDLPGTEKEQPEQEQEPQPVEETAAAAVTADKPTRKSLFQRLQERLGKTRQGLLYRLDSIFLGKKEIDEDLLDELEEILITSDLGVATTMDLLDAARRQVKRKELSDPQALKKILRDKILGYLLASDQPAELVMPESGPFVIMVVGVNGVGKTTTIGKIANKFKESGQTVLLIAADTFRAAAIDQLKIWAQRVGTDIIASKPGADPSSVVFDGLDYGVKNDFDAIIIDTAGRLHTSVNLMEELKKIKRVIGKKMEGAPHEVLLVLDATTGQNGISQAKLFGEAVGVSGLALTKLDGTAKGGIVANVCRELKIPVRFIGIGEQMDDLRDFDAHEFVDALFAEEAGASDRSEAA